MASIYKRPGSPFWWIKYRDPKTSAIKRDSTGFRIGLAPDTRKAKELAAEHSLAESRTAPGGNEEDWEKWIPNYITSRYANSPKTHYRYSNIWRNVRMFLAERGVTSPRHLTRAHCFEYLPWRIKPAKSEGRYRAVHNTALLELKILGMLMDEAVRRGYAPNNPCTKLGIKRAPGREKPELTDEDIEMIRSQIDSEEEPNRTFLRNSFEIARYQGCRLGETFLNPCADVELFEEVRDGNPVKVGRIHFSRKGGKHDTVPMHPALVPLFASLQAAGAQVTYQQPPNPSRKWTDFLIRIGMKKLKKGACFHSLRVTAATRMARANVPEAKAMKYLSHASTVVHRTYQRLRAGDLDDCFTALQ